MEFGNHENGNKETVMLVLSRRVLETLRIGEHITITVFKIRGGQVRLGIEAPAEMAIHRESDCCRIQEGAQSDEINTLVHEEK